MKQAEVRTISSKSHHWFTKSGSTVWREGDSRGESL